jgi:AraC family transcriptional regulator
VPYDHLQLVVMMPISTILEVLGTDSIGPVVDALWVLAERAFADSFLEVLFLRLWNGLEGDGLAERNFVDGILISILSHLLLRTGCAAETATPTVMPLWRLRRVEQYVDTRLGQSIALDELAAVAGVSRRHLTRSFRQQTGETPHRWIMLRRTERAREMIDQTDTPLSEIALICGFASQSHLTMVFKKLFGISPNRWRRRVQVLAASPNTLPSRASRSEF